MGSVLLFRFFLFVWFFYFSVLQGQRRESRRGGELTEGNKGDREGKKGRMEEIGEARKKCLKLS